jgi:hypothetical protein
MLSSVKKINVAVGPWGSQGSLGSERRRRGRKGESS